MLFEYQNQRYQFERFPQKGNPSLQAWSAVDEHLLNYQTEQAQARNTPLVVYNDRFGCLTCLQLPQPVHTVLTHRSQLAALEHHFELNTVDPSQWTKDSPLAPLPAPVETAWIKLPKSLDLFQLFLQQLSAQLLPDSEVVVGFMTRHFSPQLLPIANLYFEEVAQSRAWKKSRLLFLRMPKPYTARSLQHHLTWQTHLFRQYYGVFSAKRIDYASQFLLEQLPPISEGAKVLDLACGNGVLGLAATAKLANVELHLLDDFNLAVASAQLNAENRAAQLHWAYDLKELPEGYFDCILCNPPFHTEREMTTAVAKQLFEGARRCLAENGEFWVVANRHLNYLSALKARFDNVFIVKQNSKFILYKAQ
jgi:16S rRNA G1207 methylase RsmC